MLCLKRSSKFYLTAHAAACTSGEADCVEEATCIDSADGLRFICLCPPGTTGNGTMSGGGCVADECSTIANCVESASCINSADGFVCLCPPGTTGDGMSLIGCTGKSSNGTEMHIIVTCSRGFLFSIVEQWWI